jgi:hypothetical protein
MSTESHLREMHDSHNHNSDQEGLTAHKLASQDDTSGLEAAPQGTDRLLSPSSGLICLCILAGHYQRAADPTQLARALGFDPTAEPSESQVLLAAKELGLAARWRIPTGVACRTTPFRSSPRQRSVAMSYCRAWTFGRG